MDSPQLKTIFSEALVRQEGPERAAYVDEACRGDAGLRAQVETLLKDHERIGRFLGTATGPVCSPVETAGRGPDDPQAGDITQAETPDTCAAAPVGPGAEGPGTIIGPYKLLQQLGEGGMGTVFMAEQTSPVRRKVALKVIKAGTDSRQVVARFEAERQALSLMDHVNIARVLDAGATDSGLPYFVMELVHGVPITRYCDDNRLTPRQRLELFIPVCQAIQHAHQKGIIHRDIKPTNVMVTLYDGKPIPKVIDFGVAKATEQRLTERTLFTQYGTMVGTLEYMSPEQAEMSALGVDTRSDIYSLGVLLYELLTGSTPLTHQRMKQAALGEILRMIKEEEPPRPSTRLSDSGEALASISAQRHMEPARLTKLVRGELDWIVMKTLEKDRNRRYETANGFAADVQRYLNDEPVQACPPSVGYRLRKFARRNRTALATAAVIGVALMLAVGSLGWAVRDRAARHVKMAGQVEVILDEVDRLEGEQKWPEALAAARRAEAAVTGEADAATAQRVRERLRDLEFIDRLEQVRMQRATLVEGKLYAAAVDREYARAYRDYGVDVEELAVETSIDRLKARPALAIPLAAALDDWVKERRRVSEGNAAGWKRLVAIARGVDPEPLRDRLRSTWWRPVTPELQAELHRLGDLIDVRAQHPATLVTLARTLQRAKQSDAALRHLRAAQRVYPGDFWINSSLGSELSNQKDYEGAIRFYTAAVAIRPNSSAEHTNLSHALLRHGKLDEALAAARKAIELDPKHAHAYSGLGAALRAQGKLDEALAAFRKGGSPQ
jgi:eukaryotic-like serine/threonine-protein kinase